MKYANNTICQVWRWNFMVTIVPSELDNDPLNLIMPQLWHKSVNNMHNSPV